MNAIGKPLEEFKKEVAAHFITEEFEYKHELLARLLIRNYWTTNYNIIIENALKHVRKKFDIKMIMLILLMYMAVAILLYINYMEI